MVFVKKIFFAVIAVVFFSGCATFTPHAGGRRGLLDRFSELETPLREFSPEPKQLIQIQKIARNWNWPLQKIQITSQFGKRGDEFHEGIDLRAHKGTPVLAVSDGTVLYAGHKIRGYGKMVILKHASGLVTVYAHDSKLLVRRGDRVKKGRKIALSGNTGHSHGPHLHFEVRQIGRAHV